MRDLDPIHIPSDFGFVEGMPVRWGATTVTVTAHRAWLLKRVDVVTIDAAGLLRVYEGEPTFWSEVPPETPASQLVVTMATHPSRVERILRRLVQTVRPTRTSGR